MENLQGVNQDNALMNPDGSITSLGTWVSDALLYEFGSGITGKHSR
jgi:hypothetical protein